MGIEHQGGRDAQALVLVVRDAAKGKPRMTSMKHHGGLTDLRVEPAFGHRDRCRVRHMRVKNTPRVGAREVRGTVDEEGATFPFAFSVHEAPVSVNGQKVARLDLGPVRAEPVHQKMTRATGYSQTEMVVDAFGEAVHRGGAKCGCQLHLAMSRSVAVETVPFTLGPFPSGVS